MVSSCVLAFETLLQMFKQLQSKLHNDIEGVNRYDSCVFSFLCAAFEILCVALTRSRGMSSFLVLFKDTFRYNPENVSELSACVKAMVAENEYDRDVLLTVLKLYQLNPDK